MKRKPKPRPVRDYPEIAALKERRDELNDKGDFGKCRKLDERIYRATHRRLREEMRAAARRKLQALSRGRSRRRAAR